MRFAGAALRERKRKSSGLNERPCECRRSFSLDSSGSSARRRRFGSSGPSFRKRPSFGRLTPAYIYISVKCCWTWLFIDTYRSPFCVRASGLHFFFFFDALPCFLGMKILCCCVNHHQFPPGGRVKESLPARKLMVNDTHRCAS